MRPTGDWDGTVFAHEGFVFSTDQELVDRVVPFAAEGLSRGEPVLVVAGERVRTLLAEQLGRDVSRLAVFAAAESWWQGGHETLQAYDRDLRALRAAVPTWRLAAEPVWLASDAGREWSRFEAVANRCYDTMPYYSLCLHDRQRLPASVLEAVARTHPLTWGRSAPVPAAAYEDPQQFIRAARPAWHERPGRAPVLAVTTPREARRAVSAAVVDGWRARADDVVLAAHELVKNALRVAAFAEVSSWTDGDTLVVEVVDQGTGLPDDTLGYVPPGPDLDEGRGMWLAWGLADDAAVDPDPTTPAPASSSTSTGAGRHGGPAMQPDPRPGEDDVERDDAQALSRATGDGESDEPDADGTTGTGDSETFVGRVAGQDVGYAGETGAERRAAAQED